MGTEATTTLSSIEEFNHLISSTGWAVDFRQLDRRAAPTHFAVLQGEISTLLSISFQNRVHQRGAAPPGQISFGIPARPQSAMRVGMGTVGSETITCFGQDLDRVTENDFGAYTLSFNRSALLRTADLLGHELGASDLFSGVKQQETMALTHFRQRLDSAFGLVESAQPLFRNFERHLPEAVLGLWYSGDAQAERPIDRRGRTMGRALEYLHDSRTSDCRLEDVCAAASCSERTLERLFKARFGIAPKRYIDGLRLSGVHSALLDPAEVRTIGDIAASFGFWHLSLFAKNYRQRYGERPSETRMQARGSKRRS